MKYIRIIAISALALFSLSSCKSQYEDLLAGGTEDEKFNAAFDYFNRGKYAKAAQLFESLSMTTDGSMRADTVQYYWALSNYNQKDYYSAEASLAQFVESHPSSVFAEPAMFLRVDCVYRGTLRYELDQKPTYRAITIINEYKATHLNSPNVAICNRMLEELEERLDRKAYENARLYYVMEDYKAARVALKNVLKEDADNIYREEILYLTAMSSYKYADLSVPSKQKERFLVFVDDYLNFAGEYPESRHMSELNRLYKKVRN